MVFTNAYHLLFIFFRHDRALSCHCGNELNREMVPAFQEAGRLLV